MITAFKSNLRRNALHKKLLIFLLYFAEKLESNQAIIHVKHRT